MENGQTPDITEIIAKVSKLQKLVDEFHDKPFIWALIITKVEHEAEVENIWSVPIGEEGREIKKRKIQRTEKENLKKVKKACIKSKMDWQVRVWELVAGTSSLRPFIDIERCSDTAPIPNVLLSVPATIGATSIEMVLTVNRTNIKENGAQFEGPHDDAVWLDS